MAPFFTAPVAARMPRAIGRSNEAPSLRMSAGARFTVIRSTGKAKPALRIAVRTRSRLSRTAESGKPTVVAAGPILERAPLRPDGVGGRTIGGGRPFRDHAGPGLRQAAAEAKRTTVPSGYACKGRRKSGSRRDLAERTGVPPATQAKLERHVALAEQYPFMP